MKKFTLIILSAMLTMAVFANEPVDFKTEKVISDSSIVWKQFGPGMSGNNKCAHWHPTDPNVLFVAPNMGNSYVSFDGGKTYSSIHNEDETDFRRGRRGPIDITCVDFSRQDENFGMLTDERNKGIFYTTNKGRKWAHLETPIFDGVYVNSVAVDPKNDNIWYVGAGRLRTLENIKYTYDQPLGNLMVANSVKKIWKSTNKGATWTLINSGLDNLTEVETILVDPANSQIVYASTNTGFYKSFNGGTTWEKKNNGLDYTVLKGMDYYYDKKEDRLVMIALSNPIWKISGTTVVDSVGGLFRSVDRGESWTKIDGNLPIDLSHWQNHSKIKDLYYKVVSAKLGMSKDDFISRCPDLPTKITNVFNTVEVDPSNPNNIYLSNLYAFNPGKVWKTTDGGLTWHVCFRNGTAWHPGSADYNYWVTTRNNPMGTNANFKYLDEWIDRADYDGKSNNFIKFNCDGTILHTQMAKIGQFSYDKGVSWVDLDDEFTEPGSENLVGGGNSNVPGHGFFQHLAIPNKVFCFAGENQLSITTNDGDKVRPGAQAVFNVRISSNETSQSAFAIDPQDTTLRYAMFFRQAYRGKLVRSTDNGETWAEYGNAVPELGEAAGSAPRTHQLHLTIDPTNSQNMYFVVPERTLDLNYVGDSQFGIGFHKSSDGGATWKESNTGLPSTKETTKIAIDPNNSALLYVTVQRSNGGLFKSTDYGENWTEVESTQNISGSQGINDIHFSKNGKIYISAGSKTGGIDDGGVWVSEDNMETWSKIFDYPWTNRIETANWDPNTILVSTLTSNTIGGKNVGTYLSKGGGEKWAKINIGNGQSDRINDIAIDNYRPGRYYVSTYGSGWYVAQDTCSYTIVPSESLIPSNSSVTLLVDDSDTLSVDVLPTNATFDNIKWSSAYPDIVSVNSVGIIRAKKVGASMVTATHVFSGKTTLISVEVKPNYTGFSILPNGKEIKVFPNPVNHGNLNVVGLSGLVNYSVYNIQGKEIISGLLSGNKVDVSELQFGVYFLKLKTRLGTATTKFIVGN